MRRSHYYTLNNVAGIADVNEALRVGGLNWTVSRKTPIAEDGSSLAKLGMYFERDDTKEKLAIVGPKTFSCQNNVFFGVLQKWIDGGLARLESCGSVDGGRKVWMTATINGIGDREIIKGDGISRRLLVSGMHDGKGSQRMGFITHALSCSNQLARVHKSKTSRLMRISHSAAVEENVIAVADIMNIAAGEFQADDEAYIALTKKKINQADLKEYVKRVFNMKTDIDGKLATRTQHKLDDILRLHDSRTGIVSEMLVQMKEKESVEKETHAILGASLLETVLATMEAGRSADVPDFRNSLWGAYNSVAERLTHEEGRSAENRLDSNWFGTGATVNENALSIALEMAGVQAA